MNDNDIKFISYSGEWPTLCHGILTLEVNGKLLVFGSDIYDVSDNADAGNYPSFWLTGGGVSFDEDWNDTTWQGEWVWDFAVDDKKLPKEIASNKDLVMKIFNDNVSYGCCGGCV